MKDVGAGLLLGLALVAGILWMIRPLRPLGCCGARGLKVHSRHLISQLELAADQYERMHRIYPPGDGKGSRGLVLALSEQPSGRRLPFYEFGRDVLRDGHVINAMNPDAPSDAGILHYERLGPGARFRLWFLDRDGKRLTNDD
jgi:hypothetical protein